MPAKQINFKEVRQSADFKKIASQFGIDLVKDGNRQGQFKGLCPFHDDTVPSMKVNTERNIFNCFVCGEGGNILDFVMKLENSSIRNAALIIAEIGGEPTSISKPKATKAKPMAEPSSQTTENKPLTFELSNLVTEHPFISEREITPEMVEAFGLGVAQKGMMKNRLVFPIHNPQGELVAYCGRLLEGEPSDDEPKYKQPPKFRKDLELFNWHRVLDDKDIDCPLVLVESFLSAVTLHCWEYQVASPMGRSLSKQQIALIADAGFTDIVLLLDGDDPGRNAVTTVGRQLLEAGLKVTAPVVPEDFKPHRCSLPELESIIDF